MAPVLTRNLAALRSGFDRRFPSRDRTSDGWIGDAAHQQEVSGHNPDDTPNVRAEYSDPDSTPEVRAIDVDRDLRDPSGLTLYDVITRILATPADLRRLRYIIHAPASGPLGADVPTIWSRNNGWKPAKYTGSNPHDKHGHLSGDPDYDDDDSPWSVETIGVDMLADERAALMADASASRYMDGRLEAMASGRETVADIDVFKGQGSPVWIVTAVKGLQADVAAIKGRPAPVAQVDPAVVQGAVDRAVAATVDAIAEAVATKLAKRLES